MAPSSPASCSISLSLSASRASIATCSTSARVIRARSVTSRSLRTAARGSAAFRPWTRAVVAEQVVALAHGVAEPDLLGAGHEVEALLRVARDAVEQRAERAGRRQPHALRRLVAEQLEHLELVERQAGHAPGERTRVLFQLVVGHGLKDQADARRLRRGDLVPGEQVALRLLEAHA